MEGLQTAVPLFAFSCLNPRVPAPRLEGNLFATFLGMAVNALLAVTKLAAGVLGHSQALIADAVESLADIFSSIVVWRGLVVAATPADEDHPYGHGKAEPIAAALVATMLLMIAVAITFQAIREIMYPQQRPAAFTLVILLAVVVIKEGLHRWVLRRAQSAGSMVMSSDAWHHRSDAITSLAAAIGISVALLGGKGFEIADDAAAIVAAGIIAWNGWRLLRPALDELMDAAPNRLVIARINEIAVTAPNVARVEKCIVRKMGYHYYVDMHVEVDPQMTVQEAHAVAHDVKNRVRHEFPSVFDVLVHIEPHGQKTRSERP
jgi:cation diffusion facilitator family transporter